VWLPIEGSTPLAPSGTRLEDYNEAVRYYTTQPMDGGILFKCAFCEHTVTTLAFDSTRGNRRTQAAAVMNQHAAESHLPSGQMAVAAKLGSRGVL
jgi:hypothetical protein